MDYRAELFKALTTGVEGVMRDKNIDALVEVCRAARKEGYKSGYQDGCNDKQHDLECDYAKGLADAWECARSVINNEVPFEFWNLASGQSNLEVFKHYSATGAIEKIKEYENRIKVGDEVIDSNGMLEKRSVVVRVSGSVITIMEGDGTVSRWEKEDFKKTGRHFPQIAEVLKQMQEGSK